MEVMEEKITYQTIYKSNDYQKYLFILCLLFFFIFILIIIKKYK
jgi:hypothetical protein